MKKPIIKASIDRVIIDSNNDVDIGLALGSIILLLGELWGQELTREVVISALALLEKPLKVDANDLLDKINKEKL